MKKQIQTCFAVLLLCFSTLTIAQAQNDTLQRLGIRVEKLEQFQQNEKDALDNKFQSLSRDIDDKLFILKLTAYIGLFTTVAALIATWFRAAKYIEKQLKQKFDKIIAENEETIIGLISRHGEEKQLRDSKKILVVSSEKGSDVFVRHFFTEMEFPFGNVTYRKQPTQIDLESCDVLFINNEEGYMDLPAVQNFFSKTKANTLLFYFNETRVAYQAAGNEVSRLNFANSKLQVYGNLINLMRYSKLLKG